MKVKVIEPFKNAKGFFEEGKVLELSAPEAVSLINAGVVLEEKKESNPPPPSSEPPADTGSEQGVTAPVIPKKAPQKKGAKK